MESPDSVFLLSGGADSLCAVVEETAVNGGKPALVSHRPAPLLDNRQKQLIQLLNYYQDIDLQPWVVLLNHGCIPNWPLEM